MNAVYSRDEKGAIVQVTMDQISNYFDIVEGDEGEMHDEHVVCSRQLHGGEIKNFSLNM
jgi:hypothetical protein